MGDVVGVPGNGVGEEGAKALGPHLAKLNNLTTLEISGPCVAQRFHVCYFFSLVGFGVAMCAKILWCGPAPSVTFRYRCTPTGNGMLPWQEVLLAPYTPLEDRVTALCDNLSIDSPWRQTLLRCDACLADCAARRTL